MIENYGLAGKFGADFSECGRYRYMLWRVWQPMLPPLGIIMLNPSTADATQDDPTIARCSKRALQNTFGGIIVGNLYGWRATDPRDMKNAEDPVGPHNDPHLRMIGKLCSTVLCAWGAHAEHGREQLVIGMLRAIEHENRPRLVHLGLTKAGQPRHPLYIGYDVRFQDLPA